MADFAFVFYLNLVFVCVCVCVCVCGSWVMKIQKAVADLDFQLLIHFKQLTRLTTRMVMLEQLKRAPYVYYASLRETLRRQHFAHTYKSVKPHV